MGLKTFIVHTPGKIHTLEAHHWSSQDGQTTFYGADGEQLFSLPTDRIKSIEQDGKVHTDGTGAIASF